MAVGMELVKIVGKANITVAHTLPSHISAADGGAAVRMVGPLCRFGEALVDIVPSQSKS